MSDCPNCGAPSFPDEPLVAQCSKCWMRRAYGEDMPRVVVCGSGNFVQLSFEELGGEGTDIFRLDHQLVAMLLTNLGSLLPRELLMATLRKLLEYL